MHSVLFSCLFLRRVASVVLSCSTNLILAVPCFLSFRPVVDTRHGRFHNVQQRRCLARADLDKAEDRPEFGSVQINHADWRQKEREQARGRERERATKRRRIS